MSMLETILKNKINQLLHTIFCVKKKFNYVNISQQVQTTSADMDFRTLVIIFLIILFSIRHMSSNKYFGQGNFWVNYKIIKELDEKITHAI